MSVLIGRLWNRNSVANCEKRQGNMLHLMKGTALFLTGFLSPLNLVFILKISLFYKDFTDSSHNRKHVLNYITAI